MGTNRPRTTNSDVKAAVERVGNVVGSHLAKLIHDKTDEVTAHADTVAEATHARVDAAVATLGDRVDALAGDKLTVRRAAILAVSAFVFGVIIGGILI